MCSSYVLSSAFVCVWLCFVVLMVPVLSAVPHVAAPSVSIHLLTACLEEKQDQHFHLQVPQKITADDGSHGKTSVFVSFVCSSVTSSNFQSLLVRSPCTHLSDKTESAMNTKWFCMFILTRNLQPHTRAHKHTQSTYVAAHTHM